MKGFPADLMVSREKLKMQVTSNASNETPHFGAVNFSEAVLVSFNYWNYILNHIFREITMIIIQTNKLTAISYCLLERNENFSVKKGKVVYGQDPPSG